MQSVMCGSINGHASLAVHGFEMFDELCISRGL